MGKLDLETEAALNLTVALNLLCPIVDRVRRGRLAPQPPGEALSRRELKSLSGTAMLLVIRLERTLARLAPERRETLVREAWADARELIRADEQVLLRVLERIEGRRI
jgi:hypothetical protein